MRHFSLFPFYMYVIFVLLTERNKEKKKRRRRLLLDTIFTSSFIHSFVYEEKERNNKYIYT